MKHLAVLISVFLSASVSLPAALGQNLVQNPGFETIGSWSTSGSAGTVNINAHTGSYSMRATSANNGAWQQIPVTPNTTYTLSAWGKIDPTLTYLMIFVKDYGGTAIGQYFTSTSYGQKSITFTPTNTSCVIGVWAWNGSGYGYADDFVLTSSSSTPIPTPTPTPNPTPTPTPSPALVGPQVYIAIRTDGLPGTGSPLDPYDGSTAAKFDAVMSRLQWVANANIHLVGPGPFTTSATHTWFARSGWVVSGDGMYATTVQIVGSVAGIHYDIEAFKTDPSVDTNNVTIRALTIDCNWPVLSTTADTGLGGEKNITVYAICLFGSNHLVDHVRFINAYGSLANYKEAFGILIVSGANADATGNVIAYCRGEAPAGNHGSTFNLSGWMSTLPHRLVTNSQIHDCVGVGRNDGLNGGFDNGGANIGNAKNCQSYNNTFTDCGSAFYCDTGSLENIQITNNTLVRGHLGVALVSGADQTWTKNNIQITGNNLNIQNRSAGPGDGIVIAYSPASNITLSGNTISFDTSAGGVLQFWGISLWYPPVNTATVSNNIIGLNPWVTNRVWGSSLTMFNNRTPAGILIPELNNQ